MIINLNLRPVKVRTLRQFTAADPWSNRAGAPWSISLFRMVMEDYAVAAAWKEMNRAPTAAADDDPRPGGRALKRDEAIGLETPRDGMRLLPRALTRRWLDGEARDDALPELLHRLEPRLRRVDFKPLPPTALFAILAAIPGLILLALLWALLTPTHAAQRNVTLDTAQWLAAPLDAATVIFEGSRLKLADRSPAPANFQLPGDIVAQVPPDRLGVVKAARESRVVLYSSRLEYNGALEIWGGTVVPMGELAGLADALTTPRQRTPNLNIAFVLVADGDRKGSLLDLRLDHEPAFAAVIAGTMLPLLALITVLWLRPRLRERRLSQLLASHL